MIVHARRDGKRNRDPSTTYCGLSSWPDALAIKPDAFDASRVNCDLCRGELKLVAATTEVNFEVPQGWLEET